MQLNIDKCHDRKQPKSWPVVSLKFEPWAGTQGESPASSFCFSYIIFLPEDSQGKRPCTDINMFTKSPVGTHSDCTLSATENSAWECIPLSTRENFPWRRVIALCTFPQFFILPVAVSSSFTFLPRKDIRKRKERKWRLDFIPMCLQVECLSLPGLISIA